MICVSIAEADFSACLNLIKQYEFIELRLDAGDFTITQIEKLIKSAKRAIVTFRAGKFNFQFKATALSAAIHAGASFIDIEVDSPEDFRTELIKKAKAGNCKLILSHHDFESTPDRSSLENILHECYAKGADIAKIACLVNSLEDNVRLLSLYSEDGRKVVLGMGDLGRITRIAALYLGAEFSFASPDNGKPTAAGQLSIKEFQDLQNILNLKTK